MTIWHMQKLYTNDGSFYEAIPYNLLSTVKSTLKMKNGLKQTVKFLSNCRWSEKTARMLCTKLNM